MRLAYWMYEGTAHHGVGRITNSMRGLHAVFHAPQGDDYVNPIFTMLERTPAFPQMTSSVVSGRDLAMGTIRLPDTLRQIEEKLHPDLFIISASCSTILLQENLEMVAGSADIDADFIVYDANPYHMQEVTSAEKLFTLLVKRYAAENGLLTENPSVNIIGPASLGFHVRPDMIALRRIMQTLGIEINVVAPLGASLDDLHRLSAGWVNIAPYRELGLLSAQYLEDTFGTPTMYEMPMGVQPTLRWLKNLVAKINDVAIQQGKAKIELPHLTKFSLDGMSAPSSVPWFARTADMESFSSKKAFVFGDATHTVGMVKFLHDELGMQIAGAGTYLKNQADWIRDELQDYLTDDLLVTEEFQEVAAHIENLMPDLVCGTQMERHSCRKFDVPAMVIAPPTHIENHLLGYTPIIGFDGADYLADKVYTSAKLGLEKHLIDMFGDAGLEYEENNRGRQTADVPPPTTNQEGVLVPQTITWSQDAEKLVKKIPFFVRGRVRRNTEKFAVQQGEHVITADVLQAAREELGG